MSPLSSVVLPLPRNPVTRLTGSMASNISPAERRDQLGIEGIERFPGDPLRCRPQSAKMSDERRLARGAREQEPARPIGQLEAIVSQYPVGEPGAKLAQLRGR